MVPRGSTTPGVQVLGGVPGRACVIRPRWEAAAVPCEAQNPRKGPVSLVKCRAEAGTWTMPRPRNAADARPHPEHASTPVVTRGSRRNNRRHAHLMHPELSSLAVRQGGVVTAAQAYAHGYDRDEIQRLRRRREWVSVRRGIYAQASVLAGLEREERHRVEVAALMLGLSAPATVSHTSAAVLHGLDLLDADLDLLHVTHPALGTSRLEAGVRHHAAALPARHVTTVQRLAVTARARTAIDVARSASFRQAVVVVDAAMRSGASLDELTEVLDICRDWPGSRTAGRALAFGDPRSESVGESLSRFAFARDGLPVPESQVDVFDSRGLVGRVDFLWRDRRTVGEFDGRVKYVDAATDVVWREKRREDRLREAGYEVFRLTWSDLDRPGAAGERARRCFARAARRRPAG
jgi:hypothetical protein